MLPDGNGRNGTMIAKLDPLAAFRGGDTARQPLHGHGPVSRTLRSRASTRAFNERTPSIDLVREILDAARWAPSGSNLQGWNLIAVWGSVRD